MALYTVSVGICDGDDYIRHYHGGDFDDYEQAYKFWGKWWPDQDDVERTILNHSKDSGIPTTEYDLQIGLWDEQGNDCEFYSESVF